MNWLSLPRLVVALTAVVLAEAAPAHAAKPAPSAAQAVRILVRPFYTPRYALATCSTASPRVDPRSVCPVTNRLQRRLKAPRHMGDGIPLCRCQNPPRTVRLERVTLSNGRMAHVTVWWDFGPGSYRSTFVVIQQSGGGWLVDDEYCAGRPYTSVYNGIAGATPCYHR